MRRKAKVDDNQNEIVDALRKAGCAVLSLAAVGKGCPDLLVQRAGIYLYLLEVKDGSKPPSARRLTPDQKEFFLSWNAYVVNDIAEALKAVGL